LHCVYSRGFEFLARLRRHGALHTLRASATIQDRRIASGHRTHSPSLRRLRTSRTNSSNTVGTLVQPRNDANRRDFKFGSSR